MKSASRNQALLAELRKQKEKVAAGEPAHAPEVPRVAGVEETLPAPAPEAVVPPAAPCVPPSPDAEASLPPALRQQIGPDRWSSSRLLETIASSLPPDFPAIEFAGEEICPRGIYRSVSRIRGGVAVRIDHPRGADTFVPVVGGELYEGWRRHFLRNASADPDRDAKRLCCRELVAALENFADYQRDDWNKVIDSANWARLPLGGE